MDRKSMQQMRLDRRLIGREGWISKQDLARELEELPDVSAKVAPPEPADASSERAESAPRAGGGEST